MVMRWVVVVVGELRYGAWALRGEGDDRASRASGVWTRGTTDRQTTGERVGLISSSKKYLRHHGARLRAWVRTRRLQRH